MRSRPSLAPHPLLLSALLLAAGSCGGLDDVTSPGTDRVRVTPVTDLLVGVGDTARFTARVEDGAGAPLPGRTVTWSTGSPSVATVDGSGLVIAVGAGTSWIAAASKDVADTVQVEVWVPTDVTAWQPGESYHGRKGYTEYVPGTLPVVLSAPHGGTMEPAEIPPRSGGTQVTDLNTIETATAIRDAFVDALGAAPHLVILHLDRAGLDANREIGEAAMGNPFSELAWQEYHDFIEVARSTVESTWGRGLYLDVHGHGHEAPRVELGYLLDLGDLGLDDEALSDSPIGRDTSIRHAWERTGTPLAELVRGGTSLGGRLEAADIRAVPSPGEPSPGTEPFFSGGYSTRRHGSRDGGTVDGIQLELHRSGLRDTDANRRAFAAILAEAVRMWLQDHHGTDLDLHPVSLLPS